MNTKPYLTYEEFALLRDIAGGHDEQTTAKEERLTRLPSLVYIRAVEGSFYVARCGERRIKSGN